jgi:hypothetical protein
MTSLPPLRNFSHSRAVVMGTWEYENLEPVPAVRNSYERMVGLLTGPLCGWPRDRLSGWENVLTPGDLADNLIAEFEVVSDVALFYYVGHGQIDADDQLCLALKRSRTDAHRRASTSLPFQDVRKALLASPATTKIVILDCCFSGLASQPANTLAAKVLDATTGAGAYTMAASDAYYTAWYETDPSLTQPQTYFTKYLAELVEAGLPGHPAFLRLHEIFTELSRNLARNKLPTPAVRNIDQGSDFLFAYNAASPQFRAGSEHAVPPPAVDPPIAVPRPGRHRPRWRQRISTVLTSAGTPSDPAVPPAIRPFLPSPVDELAARREIEHLLRDLPPGHPDHLIGALADRWVADVRAQHAHYLTSVNPIIQAAEADARRARAVAIREKGILDHKRMALDSALLRIAGRDQRGANRDASGLR